MQVSKARKLSTMAAILVALTTPGVASAQVTYTENFNAPGAAWESGWFGVNTDYNNYYCMTRGCTNRGNAPTAIWYSGSPINFLNGFGNSMTSLSIGLGAFTQTNLRAYDQSNTLIFDQAVALTYQYSDGPVYTILSGNGISRFELTGSANGNVTMDNIVATVGGTVIPEPASLALLATGLVGVFGAARRRRVTAA